MNYYLQYKSENLLRVRCLDVVQILINFTDLFTRYLTIVTLCQIMTRPDTTEKTEWKKQNGSYSGIRAVIFIDIEVGIDMEEFVKEQFANSKNSSKDNDHNKVRIVSLCESVSIFALVKKGYGRHKSRRRHSIYNVRGQTKFKIE